jgi:hypothetical protein
MSLRELESVTSSGASRVKNTSPPKLKKFPATKQRRLDQLLEKNSEGTITSGERVKLQRLVDEAERLMAENARRLADFSRSDAAVPADAVPVTVWVSPETTER